MHELPITQEILTRTLRYAREHHAKRITAVHITLGAFTGFVDESVEFYWTVIARHTIAADAMIHVARAPGTVRCLACKREKTIHHPIDRCPACDSPMVVYQDTVRCELSTIEVVQ